ncbi:hypothetical protein D5R81_06860 [Parashewanella spongiae]|uniref:Uncharacterized protein n=1 Tax=Parashewanella spongiae TaxID=342950 RepID=A0A3A6TYB7_9GAMM|nr:metallophosphoesterase [Parashewanella spongiae]MCL1077711.1 metallophosphoesterase [Parashewanella spongiae]RJY18092.1 hypothetical protein D5R81_06860 [Parashewanella spongiae]
MKALLLSFMLLVGHINLVFAESHSDCVQTFKQINYQSKYKQFCITDERPELYTFNDAEPIKIASIIIPKNRAARLCIRNDSDGDKLCQTFLESQTHLPEKFQQMVIELNVLKFTPKDFYMAIDADPQYPWTCKTHYEKCDDEIRAQLDNKIRVQSINDLNNKLKGKLAGLITNGDLTAFGHDWQLEKYQEFYERDLQVNNYPGLGNHDYSDNVNDCYENNCAERMIHYFIDKIQSIPVHSDFSISGAYYKFPSYRKDYDGSFGYSWDIGNVHFVQLNYYPTYETEWSLWNFGHARRDYFYIRSSLNWLDQDLTNAEEQGKKTILNFHSLDFTKNSDFQHILEKHPVSAIFAGHYHVWNGYFKTITANNRSIPVFQSAAAYKKRYLLVHFQGDRFSLQSVWNNDDGSYNLFDIGSYML